MMIENADLKSMFPMIAAGASTFLDEKYLWDVPQLHLLVIFNRAHVGYYSHRVLDASCYFCIFGIKFIIEAAGASTFASNFTFPWFSLAERCGCQHLLTQMVFSNPPLAQSSWCQHLSMQSSL